MNDVVTEACARVANATTRAAGPQEDAYVILQEMTRLQDWMSVIAAQGKTDPATIKTPPRELLRTMKRVDVYQQAALLGYQDAAVLAGEALLGAPAPVGDQGDGYIDPDDEDDDSG